MLAAKATVQDGGVVTMKLLSGEEIITQLVLNEGNSYMVKNPMMLVMTSIPVEEYDEQGNRKEQQGMVSFVPWLLSVDESTQITIPKDKVVVCATTNGLAAQQYKVIATGQPRPPVNHAPVAPAPVAPTTASGATTAKAGRGRY